LIVTQLRFNTFFIAFSLSVHGVIAARGLTILEVKAADPQAASRPKQNERRPSHDGRRKSLAGCELLGQLTRRLSGRFPC
jgi:hypothetical protein